MTVLLDEQVDVRMRDALRPWPVYTLYEKGWAGLRNGELRQKFNENRVTHFVTADKNLPFQQNFNQMNFVTLLMDTPTLLWEHQRQFAEKIKQILQKAPSTVKLIHVSVEGLSRGKRANDLKQLLPPEWIVFW